MFISFQITFQAILATDGMISFATLIYDRLVRTEVCGVATVNSIGFDAGEGRQISAANVFNTNPNSYINYRIDGKTQLTSFPCHV